MRLPFFTFALGRRLARAVQTERERGDRLEIQCRRLILRQDELSADLLRLSERLSKTEGRAAGRPPRAPQAPSGAPQLDLVPTGDKAGLRRALGVGLAKTTSAQE